MAAMSSVVDTVSSVISVCTQHSGSEHLSDLDMILTSLMASSSQVGTLLDEILVTRQREVEDDALTNLRQLHRCLNQLCLEYETKLLTRMAIYPEPRGRPKKIINLALV